MMEKETVDFKDGKWVTVGYRKSDGKIVIASDLDLFNQLCYLIEGAYWLVLRGRRAMSQEDRRRMDPFSTWQKFRRNMGQLFSKRKRK